MLANGVRTADLSLLDGHETGSVQFSPEHYPDTFTIEVAIGEGGGQ